MTIILKTKPNVASIAGSGKAARITAVMQVATCAYALTGSRDASLANVRTALGKAPSAKDMALVRAEWIIGTVAFKLPAGELRLVVAGKARKVDPKDAADRIEFARDVVSHMAQPPEEGKTASKLKPHQIAVRSIMQHKVVRNAEKAWSLFLADLDIAVADPLGKGGVAPKTTTKGMKAKNAKRGARPGGNAKGGYGPLAALPSHSELVKKPAENERDCVTFVQSQAQMLRDYASKNAKHVPAMLGAAVNTFWTAALAEVAAFEKRQAVADANAAK